MADTESFAERLFTAKLFLSAKLKRNVTQKQIADGVGKLGLESPGQSTISRWFEDTIPDIPTVAVLARFFGVDPGWLAFGSDSDAPPPAGIVARPAPRSLGKKAAES